MNGSQRPDPKRTILIADSDFGDVDIERDIVEGAGFALSSAHCKSEEEVIEQGREADGVLTQYARVGPKAIDAMTHCRVIARYGTGVDTVDVEAATRHGIQVTNAPSEWCADEVADHAVTLWLSAARKICEYNEATHRGEWRWQTGQPIRRLRGHVLGLLSFGAIARKVAERARPFGVEIWAHDPFVDESEVTQFGVRPVSFDELVEGSDYLVIQSPLTAKTHHLFNRQTLQRMKPTAILINTARGPIVEDAALYQALAEGWIAGAAVDDLEEEPAKQRGWRPDSPLFRLSNLIVTPHTAYYSEESIGAVRRIAANEAVRVLSGLSPRSPVNVVPSIGGPEASRSEVEHAWIRDIPIPTSRVGLGTWALGGMQWGGADDDESVRTIHAAIDHGVTFIDTAFAYGFGHSEEVVGRALAQHGGRDQVIVATKTGLERIGDGLFRNSSRRQIFDDVEQSLRRLRTDYIDLYQVHWPDYTTPYEETAQALVDLQREGKIRAIGVSNYSIEAMQRFQHVAPLASAQPPLNLFEQDALKDIIPWCRANGVATLTYGALCRGLLTGLIDENTRFKGDDLRKTDPKFLAPRFAQYTEAVKRLASFARESYGKSVLALAVRWVLDQPGVTVALWGAVHPNELDPLRDVMGWKLDSEALAHIDAIVSEFVRDPIGPEFMAPPVERPTQ
jgi:aryl-alcohol dehydrogenase-like predicted oxidoreductase/phosphoglycerate dehydrogenase-like enzyme